MDMGDEYPGIISCNIGRWLLFCHGKGAKLGPYRRGVVALGLVELPAEINIDPNQSLSAGDCSVVYICDCRIVLSCAYGDQCEIGGGEWGGGDSDDRDNVHDGPITLVDDNTGSDISGTYDVDINKPDMGAREIPGTRNHAGGQRSKSNNERAHKKTERIEKDQSGFREGMEKSLTRKEIILITLVVMGFYMAMCFMFRRK